ncbi:LOW QUALITY PROTEIN: hypothetical protein CFOL_v3_21449, partial [Cephalotus follicularis]
MVKTKTIDFFFKKKDVCNSETTIPPLMPNIDASIPKVSEQRPHKYSRIKPKEVYTTSLVRDPGLRPLIWDYPINQLSSLLRLYNPTCSVLGKIIEDGFTYSQRGKACVAYDLLTSFEYVFILHLLKGIMKITDILYQALQQKSLNAMHLVVGTKTLIPNLREDG